MKIIKSNTKQVFDTEETGKVLPYFREQNHNLIPLHHFHSEPSDFDYLSVHFPENHSIFSDFSKSYYWVFEEELNN